MTSPQQSQSVSPLWAGSMSLDALNQAVDADPQFSLSDHRSSDSQRFWSTPDRPADSSVAEVLQISLSTGRLLNTMTFEVSHFPCNIRVEYFDPELKVWTPCLDSSTPGGQESAAGIRDSVPAILAPISAIGGHLHPQHSYSGHWQQITFAMQPFTSDNVRLILIRTTDGTPPTDVQSRQVDYSLAVRNVTFGYVVASKSDIPVTNQSSTNTYDSFSSSSDIFGSPVEYSLRLNAAENVLRTTSAPTGGQTGQQLVWKCEPQPVPWGVINFYMDCRDLQGNAQLIDRLYLEPLYDGPTMNVYYSNDDPTTSFASDPDPLPNGVAVINDQSGIGGNVLHSGAAGFGKIAFVDVDNVAIGFDPTHAWWMGGRFNTKYVHDGTENLTRPIFDCADFALAMTPQGFRFATAGGDTLGIPLDSFDRAANVTFLVSFDGQSTVSIWIQVGSLDYFDSMTLTTAPTPVTKLRFGGFQTAAPGTSDMDFDVLVLKIDQIPDLSLVNDFLYDPHPYVEGASYQGVSAPLTDNALIRYDQVFSTTDYPAGMVGGAPDRYADLVWSPIARDYVLRQGFLNFNPTKAKYWKLEFSGLIPEAYEVYQPVGRSVQVFPQSAWSLPSANSTGAPVEKQQPGVASAELAGLTLSAAQYNNGNQPVVSTGNTNQDATTARVLTDLTLNAQLANVDLNWRYLPSSSPSVMPNFPSVSQHVYETVTVMQTTKVAYFVGLRTVAAYKLEYTSTDDTDQYINLFYDDSSLSASNWVLTDDHLLTSGASDYAEATSVVFPSQKVVSAVQFAATQSQPRQYLLDDDFDDPNHTNWTPVGDGQFWPGVNQNSVVGSTLRIARALAYVTWDTVATAYPTWQSTINVNATFDSLATGSAIASTSGGVASASISSPAGGTAYAAGRVVAPADLKYPLYVQIVDSDSGDVLSEAAQTVKANSVCEWYTSYPLPTETPFRWQDFGPANKRPAMLDTFSRANSSTLGAMDTGNSWTTPIDGSGNPQSLAISGGHALVTNQGQYNTVDGGGPWGSLEFHVGTMGASGTPSPNLLLNGSFEGPSLNPWQTNTASTLGLSASGFAHSGLYSAKVTPIGGLGGSIRSEFIPVKVGLAYTISMWYLFTATSANGFTPQVSWCDANFNIITDPGFTVSTSSGANTWTSWSTTSTAPAGAVYLQVLPGMGNTSAVWYVDDLVVTSPTEAWLAKFGPLHLDNAGQIYVTGAGLPSPNNNVLTTNQASRPVVAGDDIRIDIMPTIFVPSGKADVTQTNHDAVAWPYSLVIYLNSTWVRTVSHDLGANSLLGIKGLLNQQWLSWNWTPANYSPISTPSIPGLPVTGNGNWTTDPAAPFPGWLDARGNTWTALSGSWNNNNRSEFPSRDDTGMTLTASASGSTFVTDTQDFYGAMTAYVRNVATGAMNANSSFETDVSSWTSVGCTLTQSASGKSWTGLYSGRVAPAGGVAQAYLMSELFPVIPSKSYTVSARVWFTNAVTTNYSTSINWYDANQTFISTSFTNVSVAAASWVNVPGTYTSPSNAAYGQISPTLSGTPSTSQIWWVDEALINNTHGKVMVLDADNGVYLDFAGNVVSNGVTYGNLVPGGITAGSLLTVQWVSSSAVTSTTRGSVNPTTFPDMLVAKVNEAIVGRFAHANLNTLWRSTRRGLAGDAWNGSTRPGGVGFQGAYLLDTAFQSFSWAPDVSNSAIDQSKPTWDNITRINTATYDQVINSNFIQKPSLKAQLVQRGPSTDIFDVDTLSLFVDPIVWEFSNDGGYTFYPATGIRSNPNGVLAFPQSVTVTNLGQKPGNALVWKVISYSPGDVVSSLVIRPWYAGMLSGLTHRVGLSTQGPNLMPYDHYSDITEDARFRLWSKPIPQSWFFQYRNLMRTASGYQPTAEKPLLLPDGINIPPQGD